MKLHVDTFGAAPSPALLVLHGSGAPPASLYPLAEALSDTYRVVLPHRNGYGKTGVHSYDPEAELEALAALVTDGTTILGHSFGAFRAFQLAGRLPDRVDRVVALGPIAGLPEEAREAVEGLATLIRSGADLTEAAAARWLTPAYLAEHPEAVQTIRGWLEDVDGETMARENLELLDGDATFRSFVAADVPARMYVGALDQATPPALAHAIAEHADDATVTVVDEMGHLPTIEDFDGLASWTREALPG